VLLKSGQYSRAVLLVCTRIVVKARYYDTPHYYSSLFSSLFLSHVAIRRPCPHRARPAALTRFYNMRYSTNYYTTPAGLLSLFNERRTAAYNSGAALRALAAEVSTSGWRQHGQRVSALYNNTSGSYNIASGGLSLYNNTSGSYNTASGLFSLYSNTSGARQYRSWLQRWRVKHHWERQH